MKHAIVHEYFKKELEEFKILIQLNPKNLLGTELIVENNGKIEKTARTFDEDIYNDLEADEFTTCSPLEFNLYLNGVV